MFSAVLGRACAIVAFRLKPHIDLVWIRPGFSSLINSWSAKTINLEQCVCGGFGCAHWSGEDITVAEIKNPREEYLWIRLRNEIECVRVYVRVCVCFCLCLQHPTIPTFSIVTLNWLSDIYYCSYLPHFSNSQQLMQIPVYHFCHIRCQHETRHMTEHIFIRLLFTISDKLCFFRVSYLQVPPPLPACRVNNARGDADTCLEPLLSRLITNAPSSSLPFALVRFLTFPIRIVLSSPTFVSSASPALLRHTQAFSQTNTNIHSHYSNN